MGENLISSETYNKKVNYSSDLGFTDNKFPFAYDEENIYFMLHEKYIPLQELEKSTEKISIDFLMTKTMN